MAKGKKEKLEETLFKVARGFTSREVTEEYAEVDGQMKLTKRKEIKKEIPPDLKAMQMLQSLHGEGVESMSDEELEREKQLLVERLCLAKKEAEGKRDAYERGNRSGGVKKFKKGEEK